MSEAWKLVCCIVPHGRGLELLAALRRDRGLSSGHLHLARGIGRATPLGRRPFGEVSERDVVTVVVPAGEADEVFEYLYFEGGLDQPHGGFVFLRPLAQATELVLPELSGPARQEAPA
ncbi:MAG TPA: hypothetical protein VNB06_17170 [Thermoanaerobaculia bacterium]|nr:hypothetical protein [Thermoanaerobaculia bacterium]